MKPKGKAPGRTLGPNSTASRILEMLSESPLPMTTFEVVACLELEKNGRAIAHVELRKLLAWGLVSHRIGRTIHSKAKVAFWQIEVAAYEAYRRGLRDRVREYANRLGVRVLFPAEARKP